MNLVGVEVFPLGGDEGAAVDGLEAEPLGNLDVRFHEVVALIFKGSNHGDGHVGIKLRYLFVIGGGVSLDRDERIVLVLIVGTQSDHDMVGRKGNILAQRIGTEFFATYGQIQIIGAQGTGYLIGVAVGDPA